MNIGIFCQFNAPFKPVADITVPVMREYADRHGYRITIHEERPITRSIVWDRYEILSSEIQNFDAVVHMDADVLITNLHIPLEEFVHDGITMTACLTEDGGLRLNDGVAVFRNTETVSKVLGHTFAAPDSDTVKCGQDSLEELYEIYPQLFHVERHKAMNSFLYDEYGMPDTTIGHWTPGDFVLHLPGRTNERRVELFNQILPQIIR